MESRTVAPAARAAVFTAVCTLLGVAAHLSMSRQPIPPVAVGFGGLAVFCFAVIAALAGERGLGSIAVLVGGSQIGLHLLFQAAQSSGSVPTPATASISGLPYMPGMAGMSPASAPMGLTPKMVIAHMLAAVVAAWWLRRGEAAVFAVVRRAGAVFGSSWRMLASWLAGTRPSLSARPVMPAADFGGCRSSVAARLLQFVVVRRGPPAAECR